MRDTNAGLPFDGSAPGRITKIDLPAPNDIAGFKVVRAHPYSSHGSPIMPIRAPRICGCGHVVASGVRCACQVKRDAERKARAEVNRPSARERGYDSKWDKERVAYLAAHPTCTRCPAPSTVVDHVTPHRGDRKLFWSRSNWQPLCTTCHSRAKQAEEKRGEAVVSTPIFVPPVPPSVSTRKATTARVLKAQFGNGYAQRSGDGLNSVARKATLQWDALTVVQLAQIEAFLVERAGYQAFWFTAPDETVARMWTCETWNTNGIDFDLVALSAELEETFNP